MVLSALSSTYQLYKQDTDSVAAWLASTAKSLGFSADLASTTASTSSSSKSGGGGRPKGKARAQAKKKAGTVKQPPPSTAPKYIINIKDFVPLAEYVAAKAAPVPHTFKTTIDRVIAARTGFGAKLEKHGKDVGELSDAKHQYFIQVLEKVREVLMPFMAVDDAKQNASKDDKLSNRFLYLSVYEPSQEFVNAPNIERPMKIEDDNATYEAEAETTFEHAIFALTAVIDDMNLIRARIKWIWSNYKIGVFDLTAAAIATNTAADLVRDMMEDIIPLLSKHGGIRTMLKKFHILQCLIKGWSLESIIVEGQKTLNYDTYDVGYGTYFTVYQLLEAFVDVLQPNQIPLYKEGTFGYYNPASNRSHKKGLQKFQDDRALLMPFFTEVMTAIRGVHDWPVKDELFRGIEELSKTKEVPFYAVFAAQIFLDITYQLGEDIERPFHTMIAHTATMDSDIKMHFEFHAKLKINTWASGNDRWMQELQRSIQWIGKDPLRAIQSKLYRQVGIDSSSKESHRFFRMSPVMSGLFLYHFRSRYREAGLAVADAWGSIQYCEHLYNALLHEKQLVAQWPDMDLITTNLGTDSFYVGGEVPTTPEEYFKKFALQMGTSLSAMTKKRRMNIPIESKSGPRGLKAASPVLSMFKARYVDNAGQVDFTPEHVSQIIELSLFEQEIDEEKGSFVMGQIEDPQRLKEKKRLQQLRNQGRGRAAKSGNMPFAQLIKPLVFALHAETLEYTYPYLHMHRWCWRLLRAVKDSCDSILRQLYTPAYLEKEYQLPWVVGWVLMAASGLEGGVSDHRPLQKAAEAMNSFFSDGTSSFITEQVLGKELGMQVAHVSEQDEDNHDGDS
ncbi:hypothetical protein F5Y19DRAFT_194089 [Xylariaceae sp. FL1651]|nr:hypothetical protein F5Y19DRAFT_194089 [Xylariaceae sp. FL1651]